MKWSRVQRKTNGRWRVSRWCLVQFCLETCCHSQHAMPVWSVLRLTFIVHRKYVFLANSSYNIRTVGYLHVNRTCNNVSLSHDRCTDNDYFFLTLNKEYFFPWTCTEIYLNIETSKELLEKEDYYYAITSLVIRLAKLFETNEECFENIIYLSYLISWNIENFS